VIEWGSQWQEVEMAFGLAAFLEFAAFFPVVFFVPETG